MQHCSFITTQAQFQVLRTLSGDPEWLRAVTQHLPASR